MSKVVKIIVKICASMLVLAILFAFAVVAGRESYKMGYRIFTEPAMTSAKNARDVSVEITDGMSCRDVAELMEACGLCRSENLFYIQLKLSEYKDSIKPGIYTLSTAMPPEDIIKVLGGQNLEEK